AVDVKRHVQQQPWAMMGLSAAAGFLTGRLLEKRRSGEPPISPSAGNGKHGRKARLAGSRGGPAARPLSSAASAAGSGSSKFSEAFAPEIARVKGLAIGTLLGVVRDIVACATPEKIAPALAEVIDNVTVKLGGEPIPGPVVPSMACRQSPS